ncbi:MULTISPECIES: TetR/AcrR family transcriptional regulator [unclassified Cyanobium]|uniref:TetR/AcrR family transcriptional regulator n=1 Tax=unclassified Cyanobium TaxID=2627006 RepID=UPI0020CEF6D4|nr:MULTISPECIES: TetR/AcrR family transcriptional regulator [unclassified Cyanobium]MCP9834230.1 TetR/AcrR family transcriptional regulator [Cyanobium sp. La Preciosa 7G6]MCP9936993.1 TetR/AcrR family transcriptional regulator [Cyanobium sp. Aljojuca 7A6]
MADAKATAGEPSPLRRQPRQARSQERVRRILAAAEELFVAGGVGSTTTNAIAARAGVPIGSLYQFFPDKGAILRSLAEGYAEQLHDVLRAFFDEGDGQSLSLEDAITAAVALTDRFFRDHPGYPAIFLDVQSATPELLAIEAEADARLIADWAGLLVERAACGEDAHLLAYVLVKTVGHLLWLAATQEQGRRDQLVAEAGELAIAYLRRRLPPG